MHVIFLAAGFAKRLYPLTQTCAKPLLEIAGAPLLTRLLQQVITSADETGVELQATLVSNAKFFADFEQWQQDLSDDLRKQLPVQLINNGVNDDTQGRGAVADLQLALEVTRSADASSIDARNAGSRSAGSPSNDGYFVLAGDNLFENSLAPLLQGLAATGHTQLLVRQVSEPVPPSRYSEVTLASNSTHVTAFREKPADPQTNLSAVAVYAFPPQLPQWVNEYLQAGGEPDAPGHFLAWLTTQHPLEAQPLTGRWLDIGNKDDLATAQSLFEP